MKKLMLAVAAMLAATLLPGNAFAITAGPAVKALHVSRSAVVKVHCGHHRHGCYHHSCGGCGLYTYRTRCMTCGTCGCGGCGGYYGAAYYGPQCGCGCGASGCGSYGGGWSFFGWPF
jgi:hypothetical protein